MANTQSHLIIGAGLTGLAAATELIRTHGVPGKNITLVEREAHPGGLARGFQEPHWTSSLEIFYHHFFTSDQAVYDFTRTWGFESHMRVLRPTTVMEMRKGGFAALDSAKALLLYPDLGFVSKIRLGASLAWLRLTKKWESFDSVTAESWCRKWMGNAAWEAIWEPLMVGKFGPLASQVNMAWLWARLSTRTPQLGTFKGGFQAWAEAGLSWLKAQGVNIHMNTSVTSVEHNTQQGVWKAHTQLGVLLEGRALLMAIAPSAAEKLLENKVKLPVPSTAQGALAARVIVFSLTKPLNRSGHYWYSLRKTPQSPFLAAVEHTTFVPIHEFGGEHLVYVGDYLPTSSPLWLEDDDHYAQRGVAVLRRLSNGEIQINDIKRHWVFREAFAQPVPRVGAGREIPPLAVANAPRLFFASMAHVYPWDRGTNFALELGQKAAQKMAASCLAP